MRHFAGSHAARKDRQLAAQVSHIRVEFCGGVNGQAPARENRTHHFRFSWAFRPPGLLSRMLNPRARCARPGLSSDAPLGLGVGRGSFASKLGIRSERAV